MKKTFRPLALSTLLLALICFGLPARDAMARLSRRAVAAAHRRGNHRHCRHTRAWWRNYRRAVRERQARMRRRREQQRQQFVQRKAVPAAPLPAAPPSQTQLPLAAAVPATQEAAVALHAPAVAPEEPVVAAQAPAARPRRVTGPVVSEKSEAPRAPRPRAQARRAAAPASPEAQGPRNPLDFAVPRTWRLTGATGQGSLKFDVIGQDGRAAGRASLAPFVATGSAAALDVVTPRTKTIGGQALPALRRAIIERMFDAGGWVVNDFERELDGRRVYVVLAQVGQAGVARESWTFYFTEIGGRLYTLSTNSPVEMSAPVAADSEQLLTGLRASGGRMLAVKPGQED